MGSKKMTNGLLLVIAVLLVLIVARLYDLSLVKRVQAQGKTLSGQDLLPVAIHGKYAGGAWYPIEITAGDVLKVEVQD